MLRFEHMGMKYHTANGDTEALIDINFDVEDGQFVTVIGPSGCGKSTFLFTGTGLIKPTSGHVYLDGKEVTKPIKEVGFVFQDHLLLNWRTVLDNILLQGEFRGMDMAATKERALQLIEQVGLKGFENKYPWELSGGMQQRVSICRALVHEPQLLMMDEPYGALDALTREQMRVDLERMYMKKRTTILFVTHDIDEAILLADKIVILTPRPGRVKEIVKVNLPRPRNMEVKESKEFLAYRKKITNSFIEMGVLKEN